MASVITNLQPATELDAVNAMLGVIGEVALPAGTDLTTPQSADVDMAIRLLREVTREVQSRGWRFNTEYGVEVAPTATYNWTDTSGASTLLNIFKRPAGVVRWKQTDCRQNNALDLVERPSKKYQESSKAVLVLYDRSRNRDGAEAARYPYLYIDAISAFDFEMLPETARRFITVSAARLLAEQGAGSGELASFSQDDETFAYNLLLSSDGEQSEFTVLDTVAAVGMLGGRQRSGGGLYRRVNPGG